VSDVERALHVLVARCHLQLAGVRSLTDEEWDLVQDIDHWYRRRRG
jgi:hypothetical protein